MAPGHSAPAILPSSFQTNTVSHAPILPARSVTFISIEEVPSGTTPGSLIHRSAAASRRWRLRLGAHDDAVAISPNQPAFAEYPQVALEG